MSLLITEVKDLPKTTNKANQSIKDLREEKAKNSSYLVYNQKRFNKAENKVVEYLLTDETMYTSIEKAEALYVTRMEENKKKLDELLFVVNKLKQDEKYLCSRISEETVTNVVHDTEEIKGKFRNEIESINPEIESLNHSLQVYRNQKEELMQENMILKQKLNDQYKQCLIRSDQWNKFSIIDNSIKREIMMKERLYNTMTNFGIKAKSMYKKTEEKKKHRYALKELELAQFKDDAVEMEKQLNRITQKRLLKERLVPEENYKNCKIFADNSVIRNENNLNFKKLELIKQNINAKDMDLVISHFKIQLSNYESSYNQYNKLMQDLAELQGEYSSECNDYQTALDGIEAKKDKDLLIGDDPKILKMEKEINGLDEEVALVTDKCDSMELFIKNIFVFINLYNDKTLAIMKSILINSARLTIFNTNSIDEIIGSYFNNKELSADVKRFATIKRFDQNDFPIIITCLLKYLRTWHVIYYNFIVEMSMHYCYVYKPNLIKGNDFIEFVVSDFIDQEFENEIKKKKNKTLEEKLADKKKILSGIIHSEKKLDEMTFDITRSSQHTTIEEIFKRFLIHFDRKMTEKEEIGKVSKKNKKKEIIDERESINILITKLRNKFFIHLSGYVNELVEKYQKPKLDYSKLHLTNSSSNNAKTQQKRNSMIQGIMDLLWKNAKKKETDDDDEFEDSYHEEAPNYMNMNKKGKRSHFYDTLYTNPNAKTNNEKLFNRINDLHKLNFEIFHNQSNKKEYDEIRSVCTKTMNTKTFYKLMKKSNKKDTNSKRRRLTTVPEKNLKTETTESNYKTTVTNDRVRFPQIAQKRKSKGVLI